MVKVLLTGVWLMIRMVNLVVVKVRLFRLLLFRNLRVVTTLLILIMRIVCVMRLNALRRLVRLVNRLRSTHIMRGLVLS